MTPQSLDPYVASISNLGHSDYVAHKRRNYDLPERLLSLLPILARFLKTSIIYITPKTLYVGLVGCGLPVFRSYKCIDLMDNNI